jgi:hypothetical protein
MFYVGYLYSLNMGGEVEKLELKVEGRLQTIAL